MLHVYQVTHDAACLRQATDMLDQLTADPNALGLWDAQNLGYFTGIAFPGPTPASPGEPHVTRQKRERAAIPYAAGLPRGQRRDRQSLSAMEGLMRKVALEKAYYPAGQGIVYEVAPDWSLLTMKNGQGPIGLPAKPWAWPCWRCWG